MTTYDLHPLKDNLISLDKFCSGEKGIIKQLAGSEALLRRLMDLGLIEGESITVLHEAPFGKDPIAVKVRGSMLALRRYEASAVIVLRVENP